MHYEFILVSAFADAAAHREFPAAVRDAGAGGQAGPGSAGPELAELLTQSAALTAGNQNPTAGQKDEGVARQARLARSEVTRFEELSAELHKIQESVIAALDRIRSRVRQGAPASGSDLANLEKWQAGLQEAALPLTRMNS
jgi:hypothetical protein